MVAFKYFINVTLLSVLTVPEYRMHKDILIIRCADADLSEQRDILSEDERFIADGGFLFPDKIFFRSRSFARNYGVFLLRFIGGEHLVKLSVYHHCDVVSRLVKVARDVR